MSEPTNEDVAQPSPDTVVATSTPAKPASAPLPQNDPSSVKVNNPILAAVGRHMPFFRGLHLVDSKGNTVVITASGTEVDPDELDALVKQAELSGLKVQRVDAQPADDKSDS